MARDPQKPRDDVEVEPGAWGRFEKAVDGALHTKPKPHAEMKRLGRGKLWLHHALLGLLARGTDPILLDESLRGWPASLREPCRSRAAKPAHVSGPLAS